MLATIIRTESGLLVEQNDGYSYRRVNGIWQMLGNSGKWFECPIADPQVKLQVADFEFCLRSYGADEGPEYPRGKKGYNISKFFRELQRRELRAACKNIFAPVKLKYDAHAENMARFNREVATRMRAPLASRYLTDW